MLVTLGLALVLWLYLARLFKTWTPLLYSSHPFTAFALSTSILQISFLDRHQLLFFFDQAVPRIAKKLSDISRFRDRTIKSDLDWTISWRTVPLHLIGGARYRLRTNATSDGFWLAHRPTLGSRPRWTTGRVEPPPFPSASGFQPLPLSLNTQYPLKEDKNKNKISKNQHTNKNKNKK